MAKEVSSLKAVHNHADLLVLYHHVLAVLMPVSVASSENLCKCVVSQKNHDMNHIHVIYSKCSLEHILNYEFCNCGFPCFFKMT